MSALSRLRAHMCQSVKWNFSGALDAFLTTSDSHGWQWKSKPSLTSWVHHLNHWITADPLVNNNIITTHPLLFEFRVSPQVLSTQCDHLHLLITLFAGVYLQRITGWPKYDLETNNGWPTDRSTSETNAYKQVSNKHGSNQSTTNFLHDFEFIFKFLDVVSEFGGLQFSLLEFFLQNFHIISRARRRLIQHMHSTQFTNTTSFHILYNVFFCDQPMYISRKFAM